MVKDKKSKINKMEKLRRILDNPYDPNNKKLISKEDINLETVRRKLAGKTTESLDKQSDDLEKTVDVHVKKEEKGLTKQVDDTTKDVVTGDLIEVEKVVKSKPEFVEVKSEGISKKSETEIEIKKEEKEVKETTESIQIEKKIETQISQEMTTKEKTEARDKKEKIIDFKTVDRDEIYWKAKKGLMSSDKIQIYKPLTIIEIWAFTIILFIVAISGLFLLRDWLFLNFGVYGDKFISTPKGILNIHIWSSLIFIILGLIHLVIHIFSKDKEILPEKTAQDFKSFLHSGLYLIGFARQEDYRSSGRFSGRQRIIYIALVYILGLAAITGVLFYINLLSDGLSLVHIIPGGLSIMVLLFHFLITIRKHDIVGLRCAFIDGKIPRGYARKKSPIWFKEINKKREITIKKIPYSLQNQGLNISTEDRNNLNNALLKFALLLNENPDEEDIKIITNRLKNLVSPEELKRIIELAEELDEKPEEENNQESKDKNKQSEEEHKEFEESEEKH
jgi:cytochrome b subunit of formate dehydrogenase